MANMRRVWRKRDMVGACALAVGIVIAAVMALGGPATIMGHRARAQDKQLELAPVL